MSNDYYCDNEACGFTRSCSWWLVPLTSTCPSCASGRLLEHGQPVQQTPFERVSEIQAALADIAQAAGVSAEGTPAEVAARVVELLGQGTEVLEETTAALEDVSEDLTSAQREFASYCRLWVRTKREGDESRAALALERQNVARIGTEALATAAKLSAAERERDELRAVTRAQVERLLAERNSLEDENKRLLGIVESMGKALERVQLQVGDALAASQPNDDGGGGHG